MAQNTAPQSGSQMYVPSIKTPEVMHSTVFAVESVKRLRESDFALGSKEKVCLQYDDCILVLFYGENRESHHFVQIWAQAAAQIAGPVFAACNLLAEKEVAKAFTDLNMDPTHPLAWAKLRQMPFVLVYQRGWPKAFYNGERSVNSIIDYSLTLACQAEYSEHEQVPASMQAENRYLMTGWKPYDPQRTKSTEYKAADDIRFYNPDIAPVMQGSREEAEAIKSLQSDSRSSRQGRPQQPRPASPQGRPQQPRPSPSQGRPQQPRPSPSQGRPQQPRPSPSQGRPQQPRPASSQGNPGTPINKRPQQPKPVSPQVRPQQPRPASSQGNPGTPINKRPK
jgi:hypothetical protein